MGKKVDYAHIPCLFHRMTRSSCGKSQVFWLIAPALSPVKTVTVREKRRIGTCRKVKCSLLLGIVRNIIENRAGNCRSKEKGNNLRFVTFPGDNFSPPSLPASCRGARFVMTHSRFPFPRRTNLISRFHFLHGRERGTKDDVRPARPPAAHRGEGEGGRQRRTEPPRVRRFILSPPNGRASSSSLLDYTHEFGGFVGSPFPLSGDRNFGPPAAARRSNTIQFPLPEKPNK